jgi:hypothetical protein
MEVSIMVSRIEFAEDFRVLKVLLNLLCLFTQCFKSCEAFRQGVRAFYDGIFRGKGWTLAGIAWNMAQK